MLRGKRQDGCQSSAEVIGWHKRSMNPQEILVYILFATRYLDKHERSRYEIETVSAGRSR
jgi:hypothetical protein